MTEAGLRRSYEAEASGSGSGLVAVLCSSSMMGQLPATDPLSILVSKHLAAHMRPVRDLSGSWTHSTLSDTEVDGEQVVQAASTSSWRKIAVLARTTLERGSMEVGEVLEWWTIRLYSLARLRLYSMFRTELTAVFEVLEGHEHEVPFGLSVLRATEPKFRGDATSTLEQYTVLIRTCRQQAKKGNEGVWRKRALRVGMMLAFTLAEVKDYNAAIDMLDPLVEAVLEEKHEVEARVQLVVVAARIWIQAGDIERAHDLIQRAQALLPPNSPVLPHVNQAKVVVAAIRGDFSTDEQTDDVVGALNRGVVQFYRAHLDDAIATLDAQLDAEPALVATADAVVFNTATLYELAASDAAVIGKKRQLLSSIARWAAEPGPSSSAFKL